jgi:thymidylate kinase
LKRIVVIDGVDNTGKTWLTNRLKELYPQIGTCGFPSERLTNSEVYSDIVRDPSEENKERWISALYEEELKELSKLVCFDVIVVDRLWFSTLVYQGDGRGGSFEYEKKINGLYDRMMAALDIKPKQMLNILLSYPLVPKDDREQNENKKIYDGKTKELYRKLEDLIIAILERDMVNPYLSRFVRFAEKEMYTHWVNGSFPVLEDIKRIQDSRIKQIALFCGLLS